MSELKGKRVLLAVSGGVAIYKIVGLASKLVQSGVFVEVMMTPSSTNFITPFMFTSITNRTTHVEQWVSHRRPEHIALAEAFDLIVLAPATANTIAKISYGIADNLVTSVILATRTPLLVAPAMNVGMWESPVTQENILRLRSRGIHIIGPSHGYLACGYSAMGRMSEPEDILCEIGRLLSS